MNIAFSKIIIMLFVGAMLIAAWVYEISVAHIIADSLVRLPMNGVLALSLVPMIKCGVGVNFGLPAAISAGLLGLCMAVNFSFRGYAGFVLSILFSMPFALIFGALCSKIFNRIKGREEIASVFVGFSFVSLMCLFWASAPFSNPVMLWPIGGKGMRPTIGLMPYFGKILNNMLNISVFGIALPLGMLLFFFGCCMLMYLFFKTRLGIAMEAVGENETFAGLSGIDILKTRSYAVILSSLTGAAGICVYAQSYGFIELYEAPLMMAFPAASAVLIGGSSRSNITIFQVVIGTFLYQTIYVLSAPLANEILVSEAAEIFRMMI
ncbi:MAG: ABC transporter, partial [Desulfobacteraceae bacterium IS3]